VRTGIDILENELIEKYPHVLDTLLLDHTTKKNIFWATDNYEHLGELYNFHSEILPDLITGDYGSIIMPRVHKDRLLQLSRSKEMAEVFTPSWVCNAQNNLIDSAWFGRENIFNTEILSKNGSKNWVVTDEKIIYPNSKTWKDYVSDIRLEIACGEAPYLTSRYDSTTGEFIQVSNRIGLLDRKLRIVNENVDAREDWLKAAQIAYKSIYAFEWQGDSLLLAREAMLITFIENYIQKFEKEPLLKSIQNIANIISWNVWQMDGLKGIVPESCTDVIKEKTDLFGSSEKQVVKCIGCASQKHLLHNGKYCKVMDWTERDIKTGETGTIKRFIDLLNK